jgi:hypothetical protein
VTIRIQSLGTVTPSTDHLSGKVNSHSSQVANELSTI